MSVEVLFNLQQELRRLFIAGSGLAAGDLNLKKLLPQLQKLGEAAPVFKRMAQGVEEVLESGRDETTAKLLDLSILLNSVLYTQGRTDAAGELASMAGTDTKLTTSVPYRKLQPALEALTQKGQGRMEVVRQAYEEGLLYDFRVVPAAVAALDDSYSELAEYMREKVVPSYGVEALPVLQQQLRLDGGKGDARRLELLHRLLDEEEAEAFCLHAAQAGSVEVRAAAIELLGEYPDQEAFLLEQSEEKRKELRRAAYMALSRLGTARAEDRLYQALDSKDRELVAHPIWLCQSDSLTIRVVRHAEGALERLLGGTDKDAYAQLTNDLECLSEKKQPEVLELLRKLLSPLEKVTDEIDRVQEEAVRMLLQMDMPEADRMALELQHYRKGRYIGYSLRAAVKTLSSAEVFDRFSPELQNKSSAAAQDLLHTMDGMIPSFYEQLGTHSDPEQVLARLQAWDPRWVPLLAEADQVELVCQMALRPEPMVVDYLAAKCQKAQDFGKRRTIQLLLALNRLNYKDLPEMMMRILEQSGGRKIYYLDHTQTALLNQLPASYADRLRKAAEAFAYEGVKKQVLELAEELEARSPEELQQSETKEGTGLWGWLKSKM